MQIIDKRTHLLPSSTQGFSCDEEIIGTGTSTHVASLEWDDLRVEDLFGSSPPGRPTCVEPLVAATLPSLEE